MISAKDAMNQHTWRRRGFTVQALPECETLTWNPIMNALADHGQADVADHAAFAVDWEMFLAGLSPRDKRLALLLATGEQARIVARELGLSCGRVTQIRQQLMHRWRAYQGEAA